MLARCEGQAGARPATCLADAGDWSESNAKLEDTETELFVATTKSWKHRQALREQPPTRGRIPKDLSPKERMERKLRTQRGQRNYRKRSPTIEPVFGQMEGRSLNHFLLRGLDKVRGEWSMFCTTHNLLKLWRSGWQPAMAGDRATARGPRGGSFYLGIRSTDIHQARLRRAGSHAQILWRTASHEGRVAVATPMVPGAGVEPARAWRPRGFLIPDGLR